jgi:hypothetical protein
VDNSGKSGDGGGRSGLISTLTAPVWVPVTVASITAVGTIGAAFIMRPPPPSSAPKEIQGAAPAETTATPTVTTGAAIDYRGQVLGYLDRQHRGLTERGYVRDDGVEDWVGVLRIGAPKLWEVQLARGADYRIVAVCDQDCRDLDMEVYDSSGRSLGRDTADDDWPQVAVRPAESGAHTVKLWLHRCSTQDGGRTCVVAARVLRRR